MTGILQQAFSRAGKQPGASGDQPRARTHDHALPLAKAHLHMTPDLAQSREAVKRAGRATRLLLALSVALLATLGAIFAYLMERQNALQGDRGENALYATFQIGREVRLLQEGLSAGTTAGQEASAQIAAIEMKLSALPAEHGGPVALRVGLMKMLARGIRAAPTEGEIATRKASALLEQSEALVTEVHESIAAAHARARDGVAQLQGLTVLVLAVLAITTGLLLLNLMQQLRTVRNAARVLENTAEAMSAAYEAAEAGNRAKSEFMATIGHEIRTPLNALLGMAELLSHAPLGLEERRHVEVITSSGNALLEMLNEILDFAKIEHGRMTSELVPFDLRALAAEALRIVEGRARERGNRIAAVLDGIPGAGWYRGDPTLLRRVLLNLLSNAVKFTEQGEVKVIIAESQAGSALRFTVSDTGIGIPEEARQRLFSAFSQVDSTIGRRFGGTGLGLVICKRIVEMLGGTIGFESEPGKGSCFWFEVPAARSEALAEAAAPAAQKPEGLPTLRILVVEDHPVNRQVAEKFLHMLGQTVALAKDGAEGVARAEAGRFDLILMDMQMPVMDGIAAARAIRERGNPVKIVAMTANASDDDRRRCAEAGMDGFEPKPITLARLRDLIAEVGRSIGAVSSGAASLHSGEVWDAGRLDELLAAVGEEGLRDLLRLFQADVPLLLSDLGRAVTARDQRGVDAALHALKGAAANLGLASVAALAQSLRQAAIDQTIPERIAAEISRIGVLPDLKKAA